MGAAVRINFQRNSAGFAEILKSAGVRAEIQRAAEAAAASVAGQGLTASSPGEDSPAQLSAEVSMGTTDRAHAAVTIKHPSALAMQAKHGVLTKAGAAAGLEVHAR